ncbi:hypothetical protein, partial [Teichococcus aestuarii]|uniref:hypothetical protein n=1 Tax=Teichococcus aestuarii TaxID=568898 RepID=UPI001C6307C3
MSRRYSKNFGKFDILYRIFSANNFLTNCLFENAGGEVFGRPCVARWAGCGPRNTVPGRQRLSGGATRQ